jgi:uncharacterized membrane protein YozB (DUF420 family)
MLIRLRRGVSRLLRTIFRVLLAPLREALIDFSGLSLSLRILAVLGYASVSLLLMLTLVLDLLKDRLALITYTSYGSEPAVGQVPFFVLIVSGFCFVLGWAYILTGATDSRRRVFLPVAAIFALQLFLFFPENTSFACLWFCTAPVLILALVGSHFFTRTKRFWREFPLIEFAVWFGVLLFYVAMFWFSNTSAEEVAKRISGIFAFVGLANFPLWVFFGLGLVDLAISVARTIVTTLRKLFPGEVLRALAVLFVLIRPILAIFPVMLEQLDSFAGGLVFFDALLSTLPLLALLVGLALFKRWNTRNATVVIALSFALPVFILFVFPSFQGGAGNIFDPMEAALSGIGLFAPLLLFVALMAHSVLSVGSAFANTEGTIIPRSGRTLLIFGFALLAIALTIFSVNLRDEGGQLDQSFQEAFDAFFGLGVFFLGLPYLGWVLWRRRDRLVGSEAEFENAEPVFAGLARGSGRVWLVVTIVVIVLCICLTCLAGLIIFGFSSS